ncbi:MAG: hypothetical protein NUV80_00850 [Candidatus Berkelbacteria bacterium]|nr:hypothetical protein [Candidatus Berkelbacteria bacterium]
MERTINEIKIRIADRFPIGEKYELDEDVEVSLKGSIVKEEVRSNQDGTCDLILHFKAADYEFKKKK